MDDEPKQLTMQDLMEQNKKLERALIGMGKVLEDIMLTVDRETGQIWEYILPRK
jgi:hypothetical protein